MGATIAAENETVLAAEDVEADGQYIQRLEDEQTAAENEAVLAAEGDVEDDEQYVQRLEDEQMAAENETFCPRDYPS